MFESLRLYFCHTLAIVEENRTQPFMVWLHTESFYCNTPEGPELRVVKEKLCYNRTILCVPGMGAPEIRMRVSECRSFSALLVCDNMKVMNHQ